MGELLKREACLLPSLQALGDPLVYPEHRSEKIIKSPLSPVNIGPCRSQSGYSHPIPEKEDDVLGLLIGVHPVNLIKQFVLSLLLPVLLSFLNVRVVGTALLRPIK